jgi:hypothetical protein
MTMKPQFRAAMFAACLALATLSANARADEVPLVTGEHWTKSSDELKKAYLVGIANVAQIETAYSGANPPADGQSLVPRMVRGLKGQTLDSVREALNKWYAAHPDRLQRPVIETIWFEMVVPGLQKPK